MLQIIAHMFQPDGSMQTKINVCSSENCLIKDLINFADEKGVFTPAQCSNEFPDSESSERDDSDYDGFDDDFDKMEQCKLRANSVTEIAQQGNIMALYSPQTAFEPFYLCRVLDIGIATEKLVDACNQKLVISEKYIKYN